jgi:hypothetical protein
MKDDVTVTLAEVYGRPTEKEPEISNAYQYARAQYRTVRSRLVTAIAEAREMIQYDPDVRDLVDKMEIVLARMEKI